MGYKVKRIMMWQNGEEKQVRPADHFVYYTTTANTLSYRPLNETKGFSDLSGNNRDFTYSAGTGSYSNNMFLCSSQLNYEQPLLPTTGDFTVSYRCYPSSYNLLGDQESNGYNQWYLTNFSGEYRGNFNTPSNGWKRLGNTTVVAGPANLTVTRNGNTMTLYINGSQSATLAFSWAIRSPAVRFMIYGYENGVGNVILENTAWDATKALNWYNASKSNYGL